MEEQKISDKRKAPDKNDSQDFTDADDSLVDHAPLKRARIDNDSLDAKDKDSTNTPSIQDEFPFATNLVEEDVIASSTGVVDVDVSLSKAGEPLDASEIAIVSVSSISMLISETETATVGADADVDTGVLLIDSEIELESSIPIPSAPLENGSSSGEGELDNIQNESSEVRTEEKANSKLEKEKERDSEKIFSETRFLDQNEVMTQVVEVGEKQVKSDKPEAKANKSMVAEVDETEVMEVDENENTDNGKVTATVTKSLAKSETMPALPAHFGSTSNKSKSSSPLSDSEKSFTPSAVRISLKVYDVKTNKLVYDEPGIRSDYLRLETFLKEHQLSLNQSSISSGYMADDSEEQFSYPTTAGIRKNRWTSSTLGSSIPRESMKTILTDSPNSPRDEDSFETDSSSKRKRGKHDPKLSSTKLTVTDKSQLSNGDSNGYESPKVHKSDKSRSSSKTSTSSKSKSPIKSPKSPTTSSEEKHGRHNRSVSTPSSSSTKSKNKSVSVGSGKKTQTPVKGKGRTGRVRSREFEGLDASLLQTPVEPSPVHLKAEVKGTVARPTTRFEQEVNNEPVDIKDLQRARTLWGNIAPNNLVFARWRDKNYYSGLVKQKGLNDTWIIDFDDGMQDVASETHVIPIKILGVGTTGVYTPDACFKPSEAVVLGQKFVNDPEIGETVKYAIQLEGEDKEIWCTRRQLSIREHHARGLRQEYLPTPKPLKAGEVSLENIILAPRRRTTGSTSASTTTTPQSSKKVVAGAFDESMAEDSLNDSKASASTSTPKRKGPKVKRKQIESASSDTNSSKSKTPVKHETSSVIEKVVKESPKKSKARDTNLFEGYQFFLTASGGGDPASLGASAGSSSGAPYDKDEYRELIESKGGAIVDTVGEEEKPKYKLILISDNYARTVKYIYCLAGLIPCVSYKWIQECIAQGRIIAWKNYELNAGWSLEENRIIPAHGEKPLKGFQIFITAGTDDLYSYWKPVLLAAQAKLTKPKKVKGKIEEAIPKGVQVLVTDATCSPIVLANAHEAMIPVVKPEWLVQSIIAGKKADFFRNEKYRVEVFDPDEDASDDDDDEGDQV